MKIVFQRPADLPPIAPGWATWGRPPMRGVDAIVLPTAGAYLSLYTAPTFGQTPVMSQL